MSNYQRAIAKAICLLIWSGILYTSPLLAQPFVDPCFTTGTVGTSFPANANISNNNADLLNWTGSNWTGGWPGANITLAPPGSVAGTRAIWSGDGTVWTTGGEGFGLRMSSPIVSGTTYTFSFRRVSHGTGQNGNFAPVMYTNNGGTFGISYGAIPGVGTSWNNPNISFTASGSSAGHTHVYFHNSVGSGMFMGCTTAILPMAFSQLQAYQAGESIHLQWYIQNEENYIHHRIERSEDGLAFAPVGELLSVQAADEGHWYAYDDRIAGMTSARTLFYRIVSIDQEGKQALSPVVSTRLGSAMAFETRIFPNPAAQNSSVSATFFATETGSARYQVTDLSGRILQVGEWVLQQGRNTQAISIESYAAGVYLLEITTAAGRSNALLRIQQ